MAKEMVDRFGRQAMQGSRELTKGVAAYLASLAFVVAFLVTTFTGGDGLAAVGRGAAVAAAAWVIGSLLAQPVVSTILDAMARDTAVTTRTEDE